MAVNDDSFRRWPEGLQFPAVNFGIDQGGLSRNTERLKLAGYVKAGKAFKGKLRTPAISSPGKTPGL